MMTFIVWDIDPVIFYRLDFLRWYGVCWAIGMVLGYQVLRYMYRRENLLLIDLDKLTTYVVIGVIVGARLGHILFYDPAYYIHNPIEILPIRLEPSFQFTGLAGLASHGGVAGAVLALYLYVRKYKKDILTLLDRLTIAASLLGSFIRLGNLMNSEIVGIPAQVPWAFVFIRIDQVPRHPAQLYEALFYLIVFIVLFIIWKSGKAEKYTGLLFGTGVLLIFVQRFLIEFLKENQVSFEGNLLLNMGQILSLPLIAVGFIVIIWSIKMQGSAALQN